VTVPVRAETDVVQNFLPRIVGEAHVFHLYAPVHAMSFTVRPGPHPPASRSNFARTLEAGNGLGDLRADGHDLKDRRNQAGPEKC